MRDIVLFLHVDTNEERVLEVLNASRLERFRKRLRRDAVRHADCVVGDEPLGVVVLGAEGTYVKQVLKARAELPERAVRAELGEELRELPLARHGQRVAHVDAAVRGRETHSNNFLVVLLALAWRRLQPGQDE
jgi:hypothetical protein